MAKIIPDPLPQEVLEAVESEEELELEGHPFPRIRILVNGLYEQIYELLEDQYG